METSAYCVFIGVNGACKDHNKKGLVENKEIPDILSFSPERR